MKNQYKPLSLTSASKVLRAHATQIQPPGMRELLNIYLARGDNAVSMRSDWQAAFAGMESYAQYLQQSDARDFLNAAYHVVTAGHTIYFSRHLPYTWQTDLSPLYSIYSDGTISADGSRTVIEGADTLWKAMAWAGCMIREKGEGNDLYLITKVNSDTEILTEPAFPVCEDIEYEIIRPHDPTNAVWPMRFEGLGNYLVYNAVRPVLAVDENHISGPFYSNVGRPNLGVWKGESEEGEGDITLNFIWSGIDTGDVVGVFDQVYDSISVVMGESGEVFTKKADQDSARYCDCGLQAGIVSKCIQWPGNTYFFAVGLADGTVWRITFSYETQENGVRRLVCDKNKTVTYIATPFSGIPPNGLANGFYYGPGGLISCFETPCQSGVTADLRGGAAFVEPTGGPEYPVVIAGDVEDGEAVILRRVDSGAGNFSRVFAGISDGLYAVASSHNLTWAQPGTYIPVKFIIFGDNSTVYTSDDNGATWDQQTLSGSLNLRRCIAGPSGLFIAACGEDEAFIISTNGEDWVPISLEEPGDSDFLDLGFNHDEGAIEVLADAGEVHKFRVRVYPSMTHDFSTIMSGYSAFNCVRRVYRSSDGPLLIAVGQRIKYSQKDVPDPGDEAGENWGYGEDGAGSAFVPSGTLHAIGFYSYSTAIVAVGAGGTIVRSTDQGRNWTEVNSGTTEDLFGISEDVNNRMVAVGRNGTVLLSTDHGVTWSPDTGFNWDVDLYCAVLAYGGTNYHRMAVAGEDGRVFQIPYASGSWQDWELYPEDYFEGAGAPIYSMAADNQGNLCFVAHGKIFTLGAAYQYGSGHLSPVRQIDWTSLSDGLPVDGVVGGADSLVPGGHAVDLGVMALRGDKGDFIFSADRGVTWSTNNGATTAQDLHFEPVCTESGGAKFAPVLWDELGNCYYVSHGRFIFRLNEKTLMVDEVEF